MARVALVAGGLILVLGCCLVALVGSWIGSLGGDTSGTPTVPADARGRTVLTVAYSPEKEPLFQKLVQEFNRTSQQHYLLAVKSETEDMLAGATEGKFTAISPDSAIWMGRLERAWKAKSPDSPEIVGSSARYALSPVVIAAWESTARSLGYPDRPIGWASIMNKALSDPAFRWSHSSTTTASGLLATTAAFYAGAGKSANLTRQDIDAQKTRDFVARLEKTVQQYGGESEDQVIARLLESSQRNLDAFVCQEQLVVDFNARTRGEKLVAIYPQEGTFWMDHPLVLLEGPWVTAEQRRGFLALTAFLSKEETQRLVLREGYRPADLKVSLDDADSRIRKANGVDPAQPYTMLALPPVGVLEAIEDSWILLKRPANIYLVADISGSMEGQSLDRAKEALLSFIGQIPGDRDRVGLMVFSTSVREVVKLDDLGKNRQELTRQVNLLEANGRTALYEAIYQAFLKLQDQNDPERINVVLVMTDGQENASRSDLNSPSRLMTAMQDRAKSRGVPVMVFAVGYGSDADMKVLNQIAESTKGQAFTSDPDTIRKLYRKLSAFF